VSYDDGGMKGVSEAVNGERGCRYEEEMNESGNDESMMRKVVR
jgi:hypothetical protein